MRVTPASHRDVALRHELAAQTYDRAARFWDDQGERDRADLQREMAAYEQHGAQLEHRWADLVDEDAAQQANRAAQLALRQARERAMHLSSVLSRTAVALDRA